MNFAIAYSKVGRLLQFTEKDAESRISYALNQLSGWHCLEGERNTESWYKYATSYLIHLSVIGNVKGLYIKPCDHNLDDWLIISKAAEAIEANISALSFDHIGLPARSIYRIAPSEGRLNHVLNETLNRMFSSIPARNIARVQGSRARQALAGKVKWMLTT